MSSINSTPPPATGSTPADKSGKLSLEAIIGIAAGLTGILTLIVLFSTQSFVAVAVLWLIIALILVVLWYYGFIKWTDVTSDLLPKDTTPSAIPVPTAATNLTTTKVGSEVFHIDDSQFTYNDASAVCAAYGAKLATLEQVVESYNQGAEWCGYGWTTGGMALYPTQKATWEELQREVDPAKRTACGRPGVNGGYFDPSSKFGVNCYGFKPLGKADLPLPPPGTDVTAFKAAVNKFKAALKTFNMAPYSRSEWSGYDSTTAGQAAQYGAQFQQNLGKLTENFSTGDPTYMESARPTSSANTAGPFGLRGGPGETGETGPAGTPGATGATGATGAAGAVSTVPGPAGPQGIQGLMGLMGAQGSKGDKGDRGDRGLKGDTGLQGIPGTAGSTTGVKGIKGDKGDRGERGIQGLKGDVGIQGIRGVAGAQGVAGTAGIAGSAGAAGPRGAAGVVPKNLAVTTLDIGNRWRVSDEGPALVFRDKISPGDKRYAMWNNKYVDF
jgi:hypothetical protein